MLGLKVAGVLQLPEVLFRDSGRVENQDACVGQALFGLADVAAPALFGGVMSKSRAKATVGAVARITRSARVGQRSSCQEDAI